MKWFTNLRVKFKLLVSFAVIIFFVIILALLAVYTVNNIDDSYSYLQEFPEKRVQNLMELNSHCIDMRRTTSTLSLYAANPNSVETYWAQYEKAYNNALDAIDKYIENNNADQVRDKATLQANNEIMLGFKKQLGSYKTNYADKAVAVARSTGDQNATIEMVASGASIITGVQNTVSELIGKAQDYTSQVSEENTQSKNSSVFIFVVLSIVIVVVSLVIAIMVARLISKPLVFMSGFLKKAGESGDIAVKPDEYKEMMSQAQSKDEIGEITASLSNFVTRIINVGKSLETVANGDLTSELALLSDRDTMGLSLQKMVGGLNDMFSEIKQTAVQVSTASAQIADGAQSLAEGSTDQASVVEQLSASISEISDKTNQNADIAREAADLSFAIKNNAEKGSRQMESMMQAVREINDASNEIEKVIKVIDDIAFQTNILALNAAVEAARAGEHGKGFAVVADEVRKLAAKSAEAAKDTGGLIENSVEKANLGLNIATETSVSLKEIVEGINRSAEIVTQIAGSSDMQANAIAEINTGIDQVAQVVQQNSATAEESAAASEEMSGQSQMLEELVSRFKLKDGTRR